MAFLPMTKQDLDERGWDCVDFVYVCGDAYVDHPSFGAALITRLLEAHGFRVGIIAQPDWRNPESICALGEPRLAFLVSAGNMDSLVNHYTVAKRRRKTDSYSPGGKAGLRPDKGRQMTQSDQSNCPISTAHSDCFRDEPIKVLS